jgi:hypothetical protein
MNLAFKQQLSGIPSTQQGVRHVTILLDTDAMHCFICARLALCLPPLGQPDSLSVTTASSGTASTESRGDWGLLTRRMQPAAGPSAE